MVSIENELIKIKGVDRRFTTRLLRLNIKTVRDLLWHFPSRYEDCSQIMKIADLQPDQSATIEAQIRKVSLRRSWKRRLAIVEAVLGDESGLIKAIWFNQPFITKALPIGKAAIFSGKVTANRDEIYLSSPAYGHAPGLVAIYPETKGLTSKGLRYLIRIILKNLRPIADFIPAEILKKERLPDVNSALIKIHFPNEINAAQKSKERFAFEDLFLLQLNNIRLKSQLAKERAVPINFADEEMRKVEKAIPFVLTKSQNRSIGEIMNGLKQPHPMNRLLQGDVGSGKTIVAAIAALLTARNNYQAVFMAPTEVLAKQHYRTLKKFFAAIVNEWGLSVALLTGSEAICFMGENLEAKKKKGELTKDINAGAIKIVIGTHAVIQKDVVLKNLALAIVDEQHRFGVKQRAKLTSGQAVLPHFLSMSATPIPRTLSMTLFGDLDLSTIDELPQGRRPIITKAVDAANRDKAYEFIRRQIIQGRQAFVICPRIASADQEDDNSAMAGYQQALLWSNVKAVEEEYKKLAEQIFPELKVAMLHGRMKSQEKNEVMNLFVKNEVNILVSTSVVEIGVDIPNATIMMIEGADRFGLAQLYQFRGRVGRGEHQSYCLLFTDSSSASVQQRLKYLEEAKSGFELAEKDLAMRGPGQFLGDSQTGLPDLAMRSLDNVQLIKSARQAAEFILKKDFDLRSYPILKEKLEEFRQKIHLE